VADLAFTRVPDQRRTYALPGYGTLEFGAWWQRATAARADDGREWSLRRAGWGRRAVATDATGTEVARFHPERLGRGGRMVIGGDLEYRLRPSSMWRERYALCEEDEEIATFEASGWGGRRPVKVTIAEDASADPLVLLFTGWLVKTFSDDASAAAGSTAATS
jgi:hypothetical protein